MRRSTRRRTFHAAPMPGRRSHQGAPDDLDIGAVNRAANCVQRGEGLTAGDARALFVVANRLGEISGALSQTIGLILDTVESGGTFDPAAIAYFRELTAMPAGPLFEEAPHG